MNLQSECPNCFDTFNIGDSYILDDDGEPIKCTHLRPASTDPDIDALIDSIFDI